jgi:hypothetical protein
MRAQVSALCGIVPGRRLVELSHGKETTARDRRVPVAARYRKFPRCPSAPGRSVTSGDKGAGRGEDTGDRYPRCPRPL